MGNRRRRKKGSFPLLLPGKRREGGGRKGKKCDFPISVTPKSFPFSRAAISQGGKGREEEKGKRILSQKQKSQKVKKEEEDQ